MYNVSQRDYRSLVRADSSIRSSTRIQRVDTNQSTLNPTTSVVNNDRSEITKLPDMMQPVETKPAETKRVETKPAETKRVETKPAETKPAETKRVETKPAGTKPAEITKTEDDTGPKARLRPVQDAIKAISILKSEELKNNTSTQISKILEPLKTSLVENETGDTIKPSNSTITKIEELEKNIQKLEEKTGSKNDMVMELWKLRDEVEVLRQSVKNLKPLATNQESPKIQIEDFEKGFQLRLDGLIGEVKNLIDASTKEMSSDVLNVSAKVDALDNKVNGNESILKSAIESLAKHVTSVEKKDSVLGTRISVLEGRLEGESKRIYTEIDSRISSVESKISEQESLLQSDIDKKITNVERKISEQESLLQSDIDKKISSVTAKYSKFDTEIKKMQTDLTNVSKKIDTETKIQTENSNNLRKMQTDLTNVNKKIDTEIKVQATNNDTLKKSIDIIDKKHINLTETSIKNLGNKFETTTKKIEENFNLQSKEILKIKEEIGNLSKKDTVGNNKLDKKLIDDVLLTKEISTLKQNIEEDVSSKIQSAVLKIQTERSEREREIIKEQREILEMISKTDLKLTTELKKIPIVKNTTDDEKIQKKIMELENEIKNLREKVGEASIERRSRSNPRTRPSSGRDLDSHRLAEFPLFITELFNEQVIIGETGIQNLINPKHWEIIVDTDKGFDTKDSIYRVPFPGCYDVNVLFKTVSTSVTAQINVDHMSVDGKIIKSYAIDQSALVNDSAGTLKFLNMNGGEGIRFRIQTRFNLALMERQIVEEVLPDGSKNTHHIVYNTIQIAYSPVRGFCEC